MRRFVPLLSLVLGAQLAGCSDSSDAISSPPCITGTNPDCPSVTATYNAASNETTVTILANNLYSTYTAQVVFTGQPAIGTYTERNGVASAEIVLGQFKNAAGEASQWANVDPGTFNLVNNAFTLTLTSVTNGPSGYIVHGSFATTVYGVPPTDGQRPDGFGF